jgi:hypothetical protein
MCHEDWTAISLTSTATPKEEEEKQDESGDATDHTFRDCRSVRMATRRELGVLLTNVYTKR